MYFLCPLNVLIFQLATQLFTTSSELQLRLKVSWLLREQTKINHWHMSTSESPIVESMPSTPTATEVVPSDTQAASDTKVSVEEFSLKGDELVGKIKELLHQGNIRRIILKNEEGKILLEIPLTVGVVGGVVSVAFFPVLAALGAIGAMVAHLTLVIERRESGD